MNAPQTRRSPAATGLRGNTDNVSSTNRGTYGTPLQRLEQAHERTTGHATRRGRITCPVCASETYKVAISEAANGSVLLHAFCGHSAAEVLDAMGLTLADLFPERIRDLSPEGRRAAQQAFKQTAWAAALGVVGREAKVISIAAHDLAAGLVLNATDADRLALAIGRIDDAREVLV